MRAYFFGNMYLSSIQQGIQAAHTLAEIYNKYVFPDGCREYFVLEHWAKEHKTMILLNAGYSDEIRSLVTFFNTNDNPLPWAYFNEGKDSLDGALTCVGIIVPEEFYLAAEELRVLNNLAAAGSASAGSVAPEALGAENFAKLQTNWEREFAARLNNYGLAR